MVFKYKGYLWWWCIKYGVLNAKVIYVGGVKIQWLFMMMVSKYSGYLWWWFINTVSWVWPCFQVTLCEFAHVFRSLLWVYLFSGHYCEFAVTVPEPCPAGTYMPYGVASNGTFIGEGRLGGCFVLFLLDEHSITALHRQEGSGVYDWHRYNYRCRLTG